MNCTGPWKPISQEPPYETCLLVYCDHGYEVLTRVHSELDYEWWDGLQRVDVNVSYWMMIPCSHGILSRDVCDPVQPGDVTI